jgi:hypothetical protein
MIHKILPLLISGILFGNIILDAKNVFAKSIYSNSDFSDTSGNIFNYKTDSLILSDFNELSLPQINYKTANSEDGLCSGTFPHPVGTVTFGYTPGINELAFDFQVSPSTALILGNRVRVAIARAVINSYLINQPYKAHIENLPYSFHGRISRYQRRGKKPSTFTIQPGDNITFTWIVNGTTPKAIAIRAVSCKIPGITPGCEAADGMCF